MHYSKAEQLAYQKQKLAYHIGRLQSLGLEGETILELTKQILQETGSSKEKGKAINKKELY